jgi:hypothetical protein
LGFSQNKNKDYQLIMTDDDLNKNSKSFLGNNFDFLKIQNSGFNKLIDNKNTINSNFSSKKLENNFLIDLNIYKNIDNIYVRLYTKIYNFNY